VAAEKIRVMSTPTTIMMSCEICVRMEEEKLLIIKHLDFKMFI